MDFKKVDQTWLWDKDPTVYPTRACGCTSDLFCPACGRCNACCPGANTFPPTCVEARKVEPQP